MPTRTYISWQQMRQRCDNPNHHQYKDYGGRGITYDPRWNDYAAFREDMGRRPEGMSLDRRDNDKSYSKLNCRWATSEEQQNNRRMPSTNTSGIVGVSFCKKTQRWRAWKSVKGKLIWLYQGPDYEQAVEARLKWERERG